MERGTSLVARAAPTHLLPPPPLSQGRRRCLRLALQTVGCGVRELKAVLMGG